MRLEGNFYNWSKGAFESVSSSEGGRRSKWMRPFLYFFRLVDLISKYFIERRIHVRAAALTYYTTFALIPILAFVLAISRGFGFDTYVEDLFMNRYSNYAEMFRVVLNFANRYLEQAKGGAIVGVGITMLLWSIFRMFNQIERVFNDIWVIETKRPWKERIPNYIAIVFFLPLLILLSNSITFYFRYAIQYFQGNVLLTPSLKLMLIILPWCVTWISFTLLYWFIPNTRVKFKYAAISGCLFGCAFMIFKSAYVYIQSWMTTYNAVYGALAAIPFLLLFVQFFWVLLLVGCSFTFTTQCLQRFEQEEDVKKMSHKYYEFAALVVTKMCVSKWSKDKEPITMQELSEKMPYRMAMSCAEKLWRAGVLDKIQSSEDRSEGYRPKDDLSELSIAKFYTKLDGEGTPIERFTLHENPEFSYLWSYVEGIRKNMIKSDDKLIKYLQHDYTIEP